MQRDPRIHGEGLEPFAHELRVEAADARGREGRVEDKKRTARDVDGDKSQCLVHRQADIAVTANPLLIAERLHEGLAERDAHILDGVMVIDMRVALGLHDEIEKAVAGEKVQHVIEKADAGLDFGAARAVEADLDLDLRFRC